MKYFTFFKKAVSLALCAVSVASIFFAVPFTAAAVSRFQNKVSASSTKSVDVTQFGNSLVTGNVKFYLNTYANGTVTRQTASEGNHAKMYDADLSTQLMGSFRGWANHSGRKEDANSTSVLADSYNIGRGGKYSYDIVYDLNSSVKFNTILVSGGVGVFSTGAYDLFASETEEELFSEENLVYSYDKPADKVTIDERHNVYTISGGLTARWVAMRIYNPYSTTDETILKDNEYLSRFADYGYIRINEFNVFADCDYVVSRKHYSGFLGTGESALAERSEVKQSVRKATNILRDSSPVSAYLVRDGVTYDNLREYIKDFATNELLTSDYPNFTSLTDGEVYLGNDINSKSAAVGCFAENVNNQNKLINDEKRMYYQFNYKIDNAINVSEIAIVGSSSYETNPSHFKVSVADTEAELFTDAAKFNTSDVYSSSTITKIKPKSTSASGKYFGFRIICGVNEDFVKTHDIGACYLRLRELYVSGSYTDAENNSILQQMVFDTDEEPMYSEGKATVTADCLTDENGRYPKNTVFTIQAPGSLKDENGVRRSFLYWTRNYANDNPEDRIYTPTLNLTKQEANYLIAVYGDTDIYVTYTFTDKSGNILHTARVKRGFFVDRADYDKANSAVPEMYGYEKYYEKVSFGSRTANMQMWSMDIYNSPAVENVTVVAQYKVSENKYSVKFNGSTESYAFDERVTKQSPNGKSVVWLINGVPMYKGTSFTFYVFSDIELTTAESGNMPLIALYSPQSASATQKGNTMAIFAKLNTEDYYIKECGIVLQNGDYLSSDDYKNGVFSKLCADNFGQKVVAKKHSDIGFMVSLQNVKRRNTRVVRAYVKYSETENGKDKIAYSDVLVLTAK